MLTIRAVHIDSGAVFTVCQRKGDGVKAEHLPYLRLGESNESALIVLVKQMENVLLALENIYGASYVFQSSDYHKPLNLKEKKFNFRSKFEHEKKDPASRSYSGVADERYVQKRKAKFSPLTEESHDD